MRRILLLTTLCSCSFDTSGGLVDLEEPVDLGDVDAGVMPSARKHLLLSEVKSTQSGGEFIEIANPTDEPIDLANYYLADSPDYPLLPAIVTETDDRRPVMNSDFMVRFPDGASIAPNEALVVALRPDGFFDKYGVDFDFAIGSDGDMVPAADRAIGSRAGITDSGELVALFYWDGSSDLVVDVDLIHAGADLSTGNSMVAKGDISVDGPDADSIASQYREDLGTMGEMVEVVEVSQSYERVLGEEGYQLHAGQGNGLLGDDETSENIAETWAIAAEPSPGVARF